MVLLVHSASDAAGALDKTGSGLRSFARASRQQTLAASIGGSMSHPQLEQLPHYDVLWLSPHALDALLSGTGRLLRGQAQGFHTLVVTVFGGDPDATTAASSALARLGADHVCLGLDAAHRRHRGYVSFAMRAFGGHESDAPCYDSLCRLVEDLGHRTKARDVYAPLGVGGNIDHRLLHEASARVFPVGPRQNVFFYEDRPYALVPGAVRLRLGQLAIHLPPASTEIGDHAWVWQHLWGFMKAPVARASLKGVREWTRCLWHAAKAWRRARGWRPRRAFGQRLQPIVDPIDAATSRSIEETIARMGPSVTRLAGPLSHQMRAASAYARRLRCSGPVERYWLRLPTLDNGAVTNLADPEQAPSLP
jgi:hypothetical protein